MKKILLEDTNCDVILLSSVDEHMPVFAKRDGTGNGLTTRKE